MARFLVVDSGGRHVSTARQLGLDGNTVWYFSSWHSTYARFRDFAPGVGIPEIQKVADFGPYLDAADCVCFFDVGYGGLANQLRKQGKRIFGAGRGEELEQDRTKSTEIMKQIGVKYPKTWTANGVDQALEMLQGLLGQKTETNQSAGGKFFLKINVFRGDFDSFPCSSLDEAKFMFDCLRGEIGPYASQIPIIIQESVKGIECGADLLFDGQRFASPGMWGFESGGSYCGYTTDDFAFMRPDLDKMAKYLTSVGYRGAFSFEAIYNGQDLYWIDHTTRFPMPLGLMYPALAQDFSALVMDVAASNAKSSRLPVGKWLGCMEISSEDGLTKFLPLQGGKDTLFMRYMMDGEKLYHVPGASSIGAVLGQGATMAECQSDIQEKAKDVHVFFAEMNEGFADEIREKYLDPMRQYDVTLGGE